MKVLVTGGAGYIGSHTARLLIDSGHEVVVFDNLSSGHLKAVDPRAVFVNGDINDLNLFASILRSKQIDAVIHFAGSIEVEDSLSHPADYYYNNVHGTLQVLRAMTEVGLKKIIFSSTAAVYGNPEKCPLVETDPCSPINPYGRSKLMSELMIQDFAKSSGLAYTIFRYFNVAGAWPDGSMGEDHRPESHLIPRILKNSSQTHEPFKIFGDDYPTSDGTCIRDYVHVVDIASAHLLALENLKDSTAEILNVGSENGFSVREVVSACEKVIGQKIGIQSEKRRAGDPATLIASNKKIKDILGWERRFPNIADIIHHAWLWHSKNPKGYS